MTTQTKIEWADFTVNFWEGCQKVGPGCDHCYAEARDQRFTGGAHWGPHAPRRKVKGGVSKLLSIQRKARAFRDEHGHWPRVFCSSLSDVFDNAVDQGWQNEAFATIHACPDTRVILLTKRIGNVFQMIPPGWASPELGGWPSHVGLMITVVNQDEADRDIPKLLDLKARLRIPWVGLSIEPLLGPVDLTKIGMTRWPDDTLTFCALSGFWDNGLDVGQFPKPLDWIIVGGESGHHARPMHPDWVRSLRDQCHAAGTPFLFKQWGEWAPGTFVADAEDEYYEGPVLYCDADDSEDDVSKYKGGVWHPDGRFLLRWTELPDDVFDGRDVPAARRTGKARAGRLLDGRTWDQFPEAMR